MGFEAFMVVNFLIVAVSITTLWCYVESNIPDEHIASIFNVGLKVETVCSFDTLVSYKATNCLTLQ